MYLLGGTIQLFPLKSLSVMQHFRKIYRSGHLVRRWKNAKPTMAESLPDALNRQDVSTALSSIYVRDVVHFQSKSLEAGFPGRPGGRGGILALDRKQVCEAFQLIAKFYKDCVASVTANHLRYEVNSGRHGGY
jgi:hypothetical protein